MEQSFKNFDVTKENITPNFIIWKRGKPVLKVVGTYEDARSLARQMIRKAVKAKRTVRKGLWDDISRNPTSLKKYGYRIVKA